MQSFASYYPCGVVVSGVWQREAHVSRTLSVISSPVLSPSFQHRGWFDKVPWMNVKNWMSQSTSTEIAFEMLSTYLDRDILKKKLCFFVSHNTCIPILICDLLALEEVNLLIQDSAFSSIKLCAWIKSPLQSLLIVLSKSMTMYINSHYVWLKGRNKSSPSNKLRSNVLVIIYKISYLYCTPMHEIETIKIISKR